MVTRRRGHPGDAAPALAALNARSRGDREALGMLRRLVQWLRPKVVAQLQ
jgi:hypothetical protein